MNVLYPVLSGEIARRGIKKCVLAEGAGMSDRALRYKMAGKIPFSLPEALAIKNRFFPDYDVESLFAVSDQTKQGS